MSTPIRYPKGYLDHHIRERFYEPIGRKKVAETLRYLAKFANSDTCFVYLNLRADVWEGKRGMEELQNGA